MRVVLDTALFFSLIGIYTTLPGSRGRDRMVAGFMTAYAISAHEYYCCEFESLLREVFSMQHYVRKLVGDLR